MRLIAIMPGRYNPPHRGHKAVYDKLVNKFGAENTFVATSDKQEAGKSPFPFNEKQALWKLLGVPDSQIVQTRIPYTPHEITDNLDADDTAIVFALGHKDAERFSFQPKNAEVYQQGSKTVKSNRIRNDFANSYLPGSRTESVGRNSNP